MSLDINTIIDIAEYNGITELICKACGAVEPVGSCRISQEYTKAHIPIIKAYCAHCDKFLKFLPQSKVERIWWKGSMTEVAKFETGLLMWFINNDTIKSPKIKAAVYDELRIRLEKQPEKLEIINTRAERQEQEAKEATRGNEKLLREYEAKVEEYKDRIVAEFQTLSHYHMLDLEKRIKWLNKRIDKLKIALSED